jgi:hypothetical protein
MALAGMVELIIDIRLDDKVSQTTVGYTRFVGSDRR